MLSPDESKKFFLETAIAHARTLPLDQCRDYIHGLLLFLGECDESDAIRSCFIHLDESARQLRLINVQ